MEVVYDPPDYLVKLPRRDGTRRNGKMWPPPNQGSNNNNNNSSCGNASQLVGPPLEQRELLLLYCSTCGLGVEVEEEEVVSWHGNINHTMINSPMKERARRRGLLIQSLLRMGRRWRQGRWGRLGLFVVTIRYSDYWTCSVQTKNCYLRAGILCKTCFMTFSTPTHRWMSVARRGGWRVVVQQKLQDVCVW